MLNVTIFTLEKFAENVFVTQSGKKRSFDLFLFPCGRSQ